MLGCAATTGFAVAALLATTVGLLAGAEDARVAGAFETPDAVVAGVALDAVVTGFWDGPDCVPGLEEVA